MKKKSSSQTPAPRLYWKIVFKDGTISYWPTSLWKAADLAVMASIKRFREATNNPLIGKSV